MAHSGGRKGGASIVYSDVGVGIFPGIVISFHVTYSKITNQASLSVKTAVLRGFDFVATTRRTVAITCQIRWLKAD